MVQDKSLAIDSFLDYDSVLLYHLFGNNSAEYSLQYFQDSCLKESSDESSEKPNTAADAAGKSGALFAESVFFFIS